MGNPGGFSVADSVRKMKQIDLVKVKILKLIVQIKSQEKWFANYSVQLKRQRPPVGEKILYWYINRFRKLINNDPEVGIEVHAVCKNPNPEFLH
jgi:hypothetical protein